MRRISCTFALLMCVIVTGCRSNISGSYLAADGKAVCWLQIVRTPDNRLGGQMSADALKEDGSIQHSSRAITGAVDGENVTISGSQLFGLLSFTFSGTFRGNTLVLTGAQSVPIVLKRAALLDFQKSESALNARSKQITDAKLEVQTRERTARNQENFVVEVNQAISKMVTFNEQADVHLGRFPNVEKAYSMITEKIKQNIDQKERLSRNPNAEVAANQLWVAANQLSIQADQLHNSSEQLQISFDSNIKPLLSVTESLVGQCHSISPNAPFTPEERQGIDDACSRLVNAMPPFQTKFRALQDGLAHLEQVYQTEHGNQERLLQQSN